MAEAAAGQRAIDGAGALEPRFERDRDAAREHRIEEGAGVADDDPAIAGVGARAEREVLLERAPATSARLRRIRRATAGVSPIRRSSSTSGSSFGSVRNTDCGSTDADAHEVVADRDQPEPAEIAAGDDADVAGAAAALARHAGVVREDRDVGQRRLVDAQREGAREQAGPSRGVEPRRGAGSCRRRRAPSIAGGRHTVAPASSKATSRTRWPCRTSAPLAAACSSSSVSMRSRGTCHVCGAGTSFEMAKSAKRSTPAVRRHERRAPFLREARGADAIGDADGVEHVVDRRQQRLADVEARKAIALEQHDRAAGPGERGRRRRARRPAANHDHIAIEVRRHVG